MSLLAATGNASQDFSAMRSLDRWKVPHYAVPDTDAFLMQDSMSDGVTTISGSRFPIDFYARIKPGKPIVFFFHGAIADRSKGLLPYFSGLEILNGVDATLIAFSDPTLHASVQMEMAWFGGAHDFPLQSSILPAIINKIVELCGAQRLIFMGPSAGGFAAMHYSVDWNNSLCIVINPQTDIMKYNPQHVAKYGYYAFGLADNEIGELPKLISTQNITAWANSPWASLIYLQNNTDWHVDKHLAPFVAATSKAFVPSKEELRNEAISENAWLCMGNWGVGHVAPTWPFMRKVVEAAVAQSADWKRWFLSGELKQTLSE
jgi:hypothetical protein